MEPLRLHAVHALQQAEARVYESAPVKPWDRPGVHSLPPAAGNPVAQAKPRRKLSALPMSERPTMERTSGADGKAKWVLSSAITAEICQRANAGQLLSHIARDLQVRHATVARTVKAMRASEHQQQQQPPIDLPPAEPTHARAGGRVRTAEPVRLHVLDWTARMDAWEFEGQPGQGKSRRRRTQRKCSSTADYREVYPWPGLRCATAVNPLHTTPPANASARCCAIDCAATSNNPRTPAAGKHVNPSNNRLSSKNFAGGVAVGEAWRTACTVDQP